EDPAQWPVFIGALFEYQSIVFADLSRLQDPIVPSSSQTVLQALRHVRNTKTQIQPPAGLTRLGHLNNSVSKLISISNADACFGQPFCYQVFAKGTRHTVLCSRAWERLL